MKGQRREGGRRPRRRARGGRARSRSKGREESCLDAAPGETALVKMLSVNRSAPGANSRTLNLNPSQLLKRLQIYNRVSTVVHDIHKLDF